MRRFSIHFNAGRRAFMGTREFHDGAKDGLEAIEPLDPEQIRFFE
jgi:hypothetical protein